LRSLEKDGILHSQMEPSNRGAQRKYYTLTPLGVRLLEKNSDLLLPLIESLRANINPGLS
jgi:DNA-binding PadR family transcriptional regulator